MLHLKSTKYLIQEWSSRRGKNAWMKEGHHWASPRYEPFYPRMRKNTRSPTLPEDFIQMIVHQAKIQAWKRRKRLKGKEKATVIQSFWRMWKVRFAYKHLKYEMQKKKRLEANTMQAAGRRRLARNFVQKIREQADLGSICPATLSRLPRSHSCP